MTVASLKKTHPATQQVVGAKTMQGVREIVASHPGPVRELISAAAELCSYLGYFGALA